MSDNQLFDPGPAIDQRPDRYGISAAEYSELSDGRRLTVRNNWYLDQGLHPATLKPLWLGGESGMTCGDCPHHKAVNAGNRTFHKCDRSINGLSHSAASDIRLSWPACTDLTSEPTP